jgi:SOS-response transcriptional repressor LexA
MASDEPKKTPLAERLTTFIDETLKMKRPAFAERLNIKYDRLASYLQGRAEPPSTFWKDLRKEFPTADIAWLLIGEQGVSPLRDDEVAVPLIDEVKAGGPTIFLDPLGRDHVVTKKFRDPALFALRVKGDSMAPEFQEGDYVVCADRVEDIISGNVYVVVQREDGSTIKRVYKRGGKYDLLPSNDQYEMRTLYREQVENFYPVLELQRVLRPLHGAS